MFPFLLSLFLWMGGAQSNPPPKLPPAVDVVAPDYQYAQRLDSLRDFDFTHFDFVIFDADAKVQRSVRIKNSQHHERQDFGNSYISLAPAQFFGVTVAGSDPDYVLLNGNETHSGGDARSTGIVQVITIAARHMRVVQQLTFDSQVPGAGVTFDPKSANLIIRARSKDGTPACCPKFMDVVHFHWNGRKFEQQTVQIQDVTPLGD